MDRQESNLLCYLINYLYNQVSIILTSNKGLGDWCELLGNPTITAAILDCLIHSYEVIQLGCDSHRMKHRQTLFKLED